MTVKGKYGGRKVRDGTVVSDKMEKTLLVAVEEHFRHPLYKKRVRRLHKFMAHDEQSEGKLGDRVRIVEAAPISRKKRWALVEVLERAELPEVAAESIDLDLIGEVKREEEEAPEEAAPAAAQAEDAATAEEAPETAEEAPETAEEPETTEEPQAEEAAPEEVAEVESVEEAVEEAAEEPADEPAPEEFEDTAEASEEEIATATGETEGEGEGEEAKE
jgi:small subunit ribosomal protein S17